MSFGDDLPPIGYIFNISGMLKLYRQYADSVSQGPTDPCVHYNYYMTLMEWSVHQFSPLPPSAHPTLQTASNLRDRHPVL